MSREPSRRRLLGTVGTVIAVTLAGCSGGDDGSDVTTAPPDGVTTTTSTTTATDDDGRTDDGGGGARPTVTERAPRSLDVSGAWTQVGSDPGHDGSADATATPETGEVSWHLRRVRSGPPVLLDGRLFHYATVGEETGGRPTVTRTREPDAGTAHPVYGRPALVARSASDGEIEWTAPVPAESRGWPAVAGGTVVVLSGQFSDSGALLGLSASDGGEQWRRNVAGGFFDLPVVGDGAVYLTDDGDGLRALSTADGSEQWSVDFGDEPGTVAVADGTVYAVAEGGVVALDAADGSRRWETTVTDGSEFATAVAVGNDAVYAGFDGVEAGLYVLGREDGTERWSHTFPNKTIEGDMIRSGVAAQPVVADGAVYVPAVDGLYAFGPA